MVYCAVPKVACNSWLMWLRARLGLPHPEDPLLALDEEKSGLKELAIHFTEEEAVSGGEEWPFTSRRRKR